MTETQRFHEQKPLAIHEDGIIGTGGTDYDVLDNGIKLLEAIHTNIATRTRSLPDGKLFKENLHAKHQPIAIIIIHRKAREQQRRRDSRAI